MPIIRYRTKDLTRLLPGTARTMRRMDKITGRSDDMMIIRGVNVFPTQIEEHLLTIDGLSPHYYIELSKQGHMDAIEINVEVTSAPTADLEQQVTKELTHRIKTYVGVSSSVRVHPPGGIPRSEGKAKRIVDKRS